MRVVVTGGAGYIGSVTAARLVGAGHDVVVVDDLSTGHADAVPPGAAFARQSITCIDGVLASWRPDAVVHFAAKSVVGESVADPAAYWENNVGGTLALLASMARYGVGRIVFSSSAATYGSVGDVPILESAPTRPTNPYGATKLAVDMALAQYAAAYGLAAVSLRYFNVAGALLADGAAYGERHASETHLIPLALRAAAGDGSDLRVLGTDYPTPDGTCVRDYIHVVDLADAHLAALAAAAPGRHEVVNLGSGSGSSVREVITAVEEVTGRDVPVRQAARRPGDPAVLVASNAKAAALLGWRPARGLHAMIDDAWTFMSSASRPLAAARTA